MEESNNYVADDCVVSNDRTESRGTDGAAATIIGEMHPSATVAERKEDTRAFVVASENSGEIGPGVIPFPNRDHVRDVSDITREMSELLVNPDSTLNTITGRSLTQPTQAQASTNVLILNRPAVVERQPTGLSHSDNNDSPDEDDTAMPNAAVAAAATAAAVTISTRSNNQPIATAAITPVLASSTSTHSLAAASTPTSHSAAAVLAASFRGRTVHRDLQQPPSTTYAEPQLILPAKCINPAADINSRLDTQVDVRVYPCNNSQTNTTPNGKKKFTAFTIKPEGMIIQGSNRGRHAHHTIDLGTEYAMHVGRKLPRFELADTRACQLLVTTHGKSFWVVPAPEAFSRHSGTCRLLGDRKHPPAPHTLAVGDFLRVGSVGVVVIETNDGVENRVLSEDKIQKIMKDTTSTNGGGLFNEDGETDGGT
jgi:hypothetical protein